MSRRSLVILAAAFAASFLAIGGLYWPVPYAQVSLPDTLLGPGLLVVGVAAGAAVIARIGLLPALAVVGAAAPAAVLVRIVRDTAVDPTSHNLWPFELVLSALPGYAAAFVGVVMGLVIAKTFRVPGRRG
jgi:hypothetical protein